jgi:hypothetical protein
MVTLAKWSIADYHKMNAVIYRLGDGVRVRGSNNFAGKSRALY